MIKSGGEVEPGKARFSHDGAPGGTTHRRTDVETPYPIRTVREDHLAIGNSAKPLHEIEHDDVVVRTATRMFGANVLNNDLLTVARPRLARRRSFL